jgi:group I intron endonuclease
MKKIGIYKIESPNGKVYIGQTTNWDVRQKHYKNRSAERQPKLYNSIKKYKWENFEKELFEECSFEQLNEREIFWKKYYIDLLGWKNMLFCGIYDTGGGPKSEETKTKMSISHLNKKASIETRNKISKSKLGTHHSEITKLNMSISRIGKTNSKCALQYSLNGELIKEWVNGRQASKSLNICFASLNKALLGKNKTSGGFIWKYKNI